MTRRLCSVLALIGLSLVAVPAWSADDPDKLKEDLGVLKAANFDTDSKALTENIKKRTVSEETRTKIAEHIKKLGSEDFEEREAASKGLLDIGAPARPQLRAALTDSDLETRKRAKRALDRIGSPAAELYTLPAAARVLAARKVAGTCELLLNFLPSIEEVDTAAEVAKVLSSVAKDKNGKVEPSLLKVLSDKYPVKRWAAGEALARAALKDHRDEVIKLLDDRNIAVRRRVAEALVVDGKDTGGIPALIKLAGETGEDSSIAEDVLATVAGEMAPNPPESSDDPKAKARYVQEWEAWWKKNQKIDLKKVDFEGVGRNYTLVGYYMYNKGNRGGKVLEMDKDGKVKWEFEDVNYPVYATKTRRDRVLVCEYQLSKVTERDIKGKVIWTKQMNNNSRPLYCERLNNGHTFIVGQNSIIEVDREGKDVKTVMTRPNSNYDIVTAGRHRDGTYTVVLNTGTIMKLDSSGKETKNWRMGQYLGWTVGLKCHFLSNGGIVVPDYQQQKIREYDKDGKELVAITAAYPTSVTKLPNGNYIYLSRTTNQIIEVSKDGKQVSTKTVPGGGVQRNLLFVDRK